jgi:hypothetical protein
MTCNQLDSMPSSNNGSNKCSRCGGAILRGAQGGFFCCVCGQEKRSMTENRVYPKDMFDSRMFSNRKNKRPKSRIPQRRTIQKISPLTEKELLGAQETERLNRIYDKRSKAIDGPLNQPTTVNLVRSNKKSVGPPKYRGSFQDKI